MLTLRRSTSDALGAASVTGERPRADSPRIVPAPSAGLLPPQPPPRRCSRVRWVTVLPRVFAERLGCLWGGRRGAEWSSRRVGEWSSTIIRVGVQLPTARVVESSSRASRAVVEKSMVVFGQTAPVASGAASQTYQVDRAIKSISQCEGTFSIEFSSTVLSRT